MSVVHPSPSKIEELRRRWEGQERRLEAIARDLRTGLDWTVHLRGLPYVEEVPPLPGEAYGRDLRGANLQRLLRPTVEIRPAAGREAGLVAAISLEGLRNNTALPDISPFPTEVEGAAEIALAMRRGDRFLLARCDREPVGVVRCAERREFMEYTFERPYVELSGLAVLPRWRGTGIGGRLLAQAEAETTQSGYDFVVLRTTLELGLVPWYRKLGYEERHTRQFRYPDSPTFLDVLMTKRVRAAVAQPEPAQATRLRIVRADGTCTQACTNGLHPLMGYGGVAGLR